MSTYLFAQKFPAATRISSRWSSGKDRTHDDARERVGGNLLNKSYHGCHAPTHGGIRIYQKDGCLVNDIALVFSVILADGKQAVLPEI